MMLTITGLTAAVPVAQAAEAETAQAAEIVRPNCAKEKTGIVRPNCLKDKQQIVRPNCLKNKGSIVRPNCLKEKAPNAGKPAP
jgi:hypothetical protein